MIRGMMDMQTERRLLFLTVLISLGMILSACGDSIDTNMSEPMNDFDFTTQDEEKLSLEDLKGDWWITYMSYTHCRTVCPRTTANMVDIQDKLKEDDLHPHIISFNVDPENDTPEDLREYADEYGVNLNSWDFLTGYDFDTIQEISEESFHMPLEKGAIDQISHSYMFYLVNPDGEIVKKYNGMNSEGSDELVDDMKTVLN